MPIADAPAAPPRKRASSPSAVRTSTSSTLTPAAAKRSDGLQEWMQMGALGCIARGWFADAAAIGIHGPKIAPEVAKIGDQVEQVGRILDMLTKTGPYTALIAAVLPLAVQIAVNHNVMKVPPGMAGVMPPAALEAQIQAELVEMELVAVVAQREAEQRLITARAELNGKAGNES